MPKLKTNKAVKKRFKVTASGKVTGKRSLRRHMLTDRTPKNKRQARLDLTIGEADTQKLKTMLPYA